MSVRKTVNTQPRNSPACHPGRLVNVQKTLRNAPQMKKPRASLRARGTTVNTRVHRKGEIPYSISVRAHPLLSVGGPPNDCVPPTCTVACARSLAGRQLQPRHPRTAQAPHTFMPKRTATLGLDRKPALQTVRSNRGRNGVLPTVADALSSGATEELGACRKQHRTRHN